MKRGTITIEPAHVVVALSSDGTVWMTVEEIASIFHITGASVEWKIQCKLPPKTKAILPPCAKIILPP